MTRKEAAKILNKARKEAIKRERLRQLLSRSVKEHGSADGKINW